MSTKIRSRRRRFVSASARQHPSFVSKATDASLVRAGALRGGDGATRWPTALGVPRLPTDREDLCAAYFRPAAGFNLLVDHSIHTEDHLLIVVSEGDLVIESAGIPFAVREGSSALVPPGRWRLSEVPVSGQAAYWLLFFGPALLTEAIGDDEQAFQLASQVTPTDRGVFVQPGLLDRLRTWGQVTPAANMVQTIRAMAASMSAGFYMYLREYYYLPRQALQDGIRRSWMDGADKIGQNWPGGSRMFRREFRLYHGVGVKTWAARWIRIEIRRQESPR